MTVEEGLRAWLEARFSTAADFRRRVAKLGDLERWAAGVVEDPKRTA